MGLNTSHGAWDGSYSSFNEWRTEVARHIEMDLQKMAGYKGAEPWDKWKEHPLYPLLYDSDCEGILTPEECKSIAKGLREVLPNIGNQYPEGEWIRNYLKEKTEKFIAGCELVYSKNENIEFH